MQVELCGLENSVEITLCVSVGEIDDAFKWLHCGEIRTQFLLVQAANCDTKHNAAANI